MKLEAEKTKEYIPLDELIHNHKELPCFVYNGMALAVVKAAEVPDLRVEMPKEAVLCMVITTQRLRLIHGPTPVRPMIIEATMKPYPTHTPINPEELES